MKAKLFWGGCVLLAGCIVIGASCMGGNTERAGETAADPTVEAEAASESTAGEAEDSITTGISGVETDAYDFGAAPTQMVLVNTSPYVLADGAVYAYNDDEWMEIDQAGQVFQEIYGGDFLTGISDQGEIVCVGDSDFVEDMSLGSAAVINNAEIAREELNGLSVRQLNGRLPDELIMALLADGTVRSFYNGSEITDEAEQLETMKVASVSGDYLLTEDGDVYSVQIVGEDDPVLRLKKISEEKVTAISACGDRMCAGILQGGSVQLWSDYEGDITADFQNAETLTVGANYCAALTEDGKVCFGAYDAEKQELVCAHLEGHDAKAVLIACYSGRLAVMYEDQHICMMDIY